MKRTPVPRLDHSEEFVRGFFARSDYLDRMVLRPLSHIAPHWEIAWDGQRYEPESLSFAADLNVVIDSIATTRRPDRYHDDEDRLAERTLTELKWPIQKRGGRWIGADYQSILEQGAFSDVGQRDLLSAATGRAHTSLDHGNRHFDEIDDDAHMIMLAALITIIIYHRFSAGTSLLVEENGEDECLPI